MLVFFGYLMLVGLALSGAAIILVLGLGQLVGEQLRLVVTSGMLLVLGTIPPTVMGVLWYARTADYVWAIHGPGLFARLGGGPAMAAGFALTVLWTLGCWTAALWLALRACRRA